MADTLDTTPLYDDHVIDPTFPRTATNVRTLNHVDYAAMAAVIVKIEVPSVRMAAAQAIVGAARYAGVRFASRRFLKACGVASL